MNWTGMLVGVAALCCIGLWHPIVTKGEYYLGKRKCIVLFAIVGVLAVVGSLLIRSNLLSAVVGIFGVSALWGIVEVIHQEKRVAKGWFPKRDK